MTPAEIDAGLTRIATSAPALEFATVRELAEKVKARGPRRYLLRGMWPAGDYGVMAAEMKAQKTWNAVDMAVSVASVTKWLGHVPVDTPGPVLMFCGEGGEGNILRRIYAIAEERGVCADDLPITICARAPHLRNAAHLAAIDERLRAIRPVLTVLDPLYLSARGADGANLYAMAEVLESVQHLCQSHGSALLMVTHFNRKAGDGALRISGAGPAEWGRVLMSATVKSRHTDRMSKETTVLTEIQVIGGEIPDQTFRVLRRIRAERPDDLDSPLHVHTTVTAAEDADTDTAVAEALPPAAVKLLDAMRAIGAPATQRQIVDWVASRHGHGLKRETVSRTLNDLARRGYVTPHELDADAGRFSPKYWGLVDPSPCDPCDVTRDHHSPCDRVIARDLPIRDHAITSHGGDHTVEAQGRDHTEVDSGRF